MTPKCSLADYTEAEFLCLVEEICSATGGEEYQDDLLENFIEVSGHPSGSDLIFYPEDGAEDSPKGITETVKKWRAVNGLPGFKAG